MATCGRGGGCNTPELVARRKAEAKAIHDEFVRQHIAKQKLASVTPKAFKKQSSCVLDCKWSNCVRCGGFHPTA